MKDIDLYSQILGIQSPWRVHDVELDLPNETVSVFVEPEPGASLACPKCGTVCPGYDKRQRQWCHLDTCQYKTLLVADLPRVTCPEHGVITIHVPWGESGSGFTALFEALVIDWLKEASTQAVCRRFKLSWNAIDGIMQRAVLRGLKRREAMPVRRIAVDETSFRKRHDYVTVVSGHETGTVLHVSLGRKKEDLVEYYDTLINRRDRLQLTDRVIDKVLTELKQLRKPWKGLLEISFLSDMMKEKYLSVLENRFERLFD